MKKLVSYCGERVPVIDEETGEPTGEFTQPDGSPIVEGWIDLTDDEVAEIEAMQTAEPEPPPLPIPSIVASGGYTVVDGQIDTLNVVAGITAAFAVDTGTYWLFFTEPQPDLSYVVTPGCSEGRINTTNRTTDFFELCVKDDGGALINPTEFSVNVVRTQ